MKNIIDILKAQGIELSDEQINVINKETLENYKTIKDYEKQSEKLRLEKEKNTTINDDFENFKKNYEGVNVEELNTQIKDLTTKVSQTESDYQKQLKTLTLNETMKSVASELGCVDFDLASKLIDMNSLYELEDAKPKITELFGEIKTSKPILFQDQTIKQDGFIKDLGVIDGIDSDMAIMRDAMGLTKETK